MRSGDIIVALDRTPVASVGDVGQELARRRVGETVRLSVIRDGQEISLSVTLREMPHQ